jgi:ubiquinone biosynthesis monooxygenase Coq7
MTHRAYRFSDRLLIGLDQALSTVFGSPQQTDRPNPASREQEADLTAEEQEHIARLMRINHTGEVCAQGLYQGQALTAKLPEVRDSMEQAAAEENDHLAWCEKRIKELGNRKSLLNPLWYAGSFAMGATAGLTGDKWSLGFVAETERQVCAHLNDHLGQIPLHDRKSRAILEQMKEDEARHATTALEGGGVELPGPIKLAMKITAKTMTKSVYWL